MGSDLAVLARRGGDGARTAIAQTHTLACCLGSVCDFVDLIATIAQTDPPPGKTVRF
jgi:hypothetical protein